MIMNEQWRNKKVAFLGDSITDKIHVGTTKNYWEYLAEDCGIIPLVYGINGHRWSGIRGQAEKLLAKQRQKWCESLYFRKYSNGFCLVYEMPSCNCRIG